MKTTLKKSLKLKKRTIRKLDVRSGLQGGAPAEGLYFDTFGCTADTCYCPETFLCDGKGGNGDGGGGGGKGR